jgi:hypothetical protein
MELYKELKKLGNHLISIRHAENFFFIDLKFPKSWLINQKLFEDKKVVPFSLKNNEDEAGISFVAEDNEAQFNNVINKILVVIKKNIEIEKKNQLLNDSIEKLKILFNKSKLDDLNHLEFLINKKETLDYENDESPKTASNPE